MMSGMSMNMASTVARNKALARRFYAEVFNGKNLAAAGKYIAPNCVEHTPSPGQGSGVQGFKKAFSQFFAAFPDLHFTVDNMIGEGNQVMIRWTMRGTNKGRFMGMPATGRKVMVHGVDIIRVANGKAVEHWGYEDDMAMMEQLKPQRR
jgi:steroid delta-isomerase-like uncharacterized protein